MKSSKFNVGQEVLVMMACGCCDYVGVVTSMYPSIIGDDETYFYEVDDGVGNLAEVEEDCLEYAS